MFLHYLRHRQNQPTWRLGILPLIIVCPVLSGCGGVEPKDGLVEAYGYVTLDGEPLAKALVTFDHPSEAGTYGRTDSSGYFEMKFTMSQEGAFQGENEVSFSTADPEMGIEEIVPNQFLPGKSDLKAEVTDGGSPYNFDLQSTPSSE